MGGAKVAAMRGVKAAEPKKNVPSRVKASAREAIRAAGPFEPPAPLPEGDEMRFVVAMCDEFRDFILLEELREAGLAAYAPEMRVVISSSRKGFVVARRPLFPGYVFVAALAGAAPRIETLEGLKGFAGLIRRDAGPALIGRRLVDAIWREQATGRWDCRTPPKRRRAPYRPGDKVEILAGAFSGFLAEVTAADKPGRVELLVEMFGRLSAVDIGLEQVRAA
ncbi:transcription termination/antitermination protein [Microcystis phage vB_MweS-yong2]|nr:transcription termination/antitermination protein [Microcystis phage vB_MweS-yong2]